MLTSRGLVVTVLAAALGFACPAGMANAATISLSTVIGQGPYGSGGIEYFRYSYNCSASTSTASSLVSAPTSRCQTSPAGSIAGSAAARGAFDETGLSLGVSAAISSTNLAGFYDGKPWGAEADAYADFRDTLLATGGTAGDTGYVHMEFDVHGTRTGSGFTSGFAELDWYTGKYFSTQLGYKTLADEDTVAFDIPVLFGTPQNFRLRMWGQALIVGASSMTVDFYNTATLERVDVLDAGKNVVSGGSVTGLGGVSYTPATPVPEPASMVLLGTGAIGLARRVWGRRKP